MKRLLSIIVIAVTMTALCLGIFSNAVEIADDPSLVYTPQKAEYEDESLSLWFEHSFKKVMTSDTTHSGMDTYSVYMAKNEKENAQFILYSDETKSGLSASVTSFTDGKGNTIDATLNYQAYITLSNVNTLGHIGATEENSIIRNGEQPDPLIRFARIKTFQLNAGKSQAFYISLETTEDTPSGWYSAQLDITNADGQIIKTATVYAYVWDFVIDDAPSLKTAFYLDNNTAYSGSYAAFYEYLIDNKLNPMDVPGTLNSSNPYVTDERVQAIRVASTGGGYNKVYMDNTAAYSGYASMYADLSSMAEWEEIKDKFYFYTVDEAMSYEHQYNINTGTLGSTIDDVNARADLVRSYWPDASTVVPYHENHPYPYVYYEAPISSYSTSAIKDGLQEMLDEDSVNIWCPQIYAFTPSYETDAAGYNGANAGTAKVATLSGTISGAIRHGESGFLWEKVYGDARDRMLSSVIINNAKSNINHELWGYCAGWNKSYTYANHLIESSGIQTKMLFWQLYQNDATGYLYYATNNWDNRDYTDTTVTGDRTNFAWRTNHKEYATGNIYGNGVLFYGPKQAKITGSYIGSIRVEHIRDGIEEYEMLTMLEELCGSRAADAIVNSVSKNVVNYLSLPNFDRSSFDAGLDDYDVMANVRIQLGNAVEAATADTCQHSYGEGVVTKEAGCLTLGEKTYTCSSCGAEDVEFIPALHTEGSCFERVVTTAPTCTTNGSITSTCTICGYYKVETILAYHTDKEAYCTQNAGNGNVNVVIKPTELVYHDDAENYTYTSLTAGSHNIFCAHCGERLDNQAHTLNVKYTNTCDAAGEKIEYCAYCDYSATVAEVEAKGHNLKSETKAPTCSKAGYKKSYCYNCDYVEETVLEATGEHNYVEGVCSVCGTVDENYQPPYTVGDINNDGNINVQDIFRMKLIIKTLVEPTETERAAADITGDGLVNAADTFKLSYRVLNGEWA
ncbi:MAG: DUF4091 domain-containing protein [Clostridia bacterium]|nr:DUF4091 domain-containing protein [Clostridia bacterium]